VSPGDSFFSAISATPHYLSALALRRENTSGSGAGAGARSGSAFGRVAAGSGASAGVTAPSRSRWNWDYHQPLKIRGLEPGPVVAVEESQLFWRHVRATNVPGVWILERYDDWLMSIWIGPPDLEALRALPTAFPLGATPTAKELERRAEAGRAAMKAWEEQRVREQAERDAREWAARTARPPSPPPSVASRPAGPPPLSPAETARLEELRRLVDAAGADFKAALKVTPDWRTMHKEIYTAPGTRPERTASRSARRRRCTTWAARAGTNGSRSRRAPRWASSDARERCSSASRARAARCRSA